MSVAKVELGRDVSTRQLVHFIMLTASVARTPKRSSFKLKGSSRPNSDFSKAVEAGSMLRYSLLILSRRNLTRPWFMAVQD